MKKIGTVLWDGWMWFADKVGWINEHILLGVVYFVFIGIYAILYDLVLLLKAKPKSMWRNFEHQPNTLEALEKQF
ncbi:hypothetical protein GW756_00135 [bacterium]|nr:hypothetical protein [bacterium]NCQ54765.1 hypothetical protein [Candidatus Parcubacteria bacterium]NCS68018.1 hypothetical protein [Candidatus Peregrinibacteria bacterium]NCS95755.1 hypothetical protein [bacterium]